MSRIPGILVALAVVVGLVVLPATVALADGDIFTKLDDPAALPTGVGYNVAFSSDSAYMAVAHYQHPNITVYKRDGDTFTKLDQPAEPPAGTGYGVAFCPDSTYMAVAHGSSPFVTIYKRDEDTFTKLPDPAALPPNTGYGVAFCPDSTYMAVAHVDHPFLTIYKRDEDTFTKLTNPAALPTGTAWGVAFSPDSSYMAVAHTTPPRVTIYEKDGDTFTKLTNPATLPPSTGRSVAFSSDSAHMAVAHTMSPYVSIYKREGDAFTKLPNPIDLPPGEGLDVAFSSNSAYMAVAHRYHPYVIVYKRDGDTFTKLDQPAEPPVGTVGRGIAFNSNSAHMAVAHEHSPFVTIYKVTTTGPVQNVTKGTYYDTIQDAIADADPGDTIVVAGGSYNEYLNVNVEGLTLQGPYADTPGYDPTRNPDEAVIDGAVIIEADDVTFRGFVVQGGPFGIALGDASECTIENNIIRDNEVGILLLGGTLREGAEPAELTTDRNTIRGNRIHENTDGQGSGGGIVLINCSHTMIEHNHIHDNDGVGIGITGGKFGWDSQEEEWMFEGESLHNRVLGNEVYGHMHGDDDGLWPAFGVFIANASGTLVAGNSICENFLGMMVLGLSVSGDSDHEGVATDNDILSNDICDNEAGGIAVLLDSGTLSILNNSILRNGDHGVMVGYLDDGGSVAIHYNCITDHGEYGVSLDGNGGYQPLDANLNWWGDTSGPYNATDNPGGTGDAVSDDVDFDPWLIGLDYTGDIAFTGADNVLLQATLSGSDNGAQGAMVDFYVDGNHAGSADTDLNGVAELDIGTLAAGDYEVTVSAAGCFEATAELEVKTVAPTIPPVGGTGHLVNRLVLLAPWLALAAIVAGALVFVRRRHAQS